MSKSARSRVEQHFSGGPKKDDKVIKQKEKAERERDGRMARLRDLRLAKEAEQAAESAGPLSAQPPQDTPPRS